MSVHDCLVGAAGTAAPPTLLFYLYKVTVFSANIGYAYNKEQEKLSLNLRHNRKKH